jgi:hypothetical protein
VGCLTVRQPQGRRPYPPGAGLLVNRTTRAALGTPGSLGAAWHASEFGTKEAQWLPSTPITAATPRGTAGSADLILRNGRIFTGIPAKAAGGRDELDR